jgi:hypothetical protein
VRRRPPAFDERSNGFLAPFLFEFAERQDRRLRNMNVFQFASQGVLIATKPLISTFSGLVRRKPRAIGP